MRFSASITLLFASHASFLAAETCQSYCDGLGGCRSGDHVYGSYCKTWQDPDVCFGLYWLDEAQTTMCFQPGSPGTCPEERPVRCPTVRDECEDICASTPGCITDHHGSYCKTWLNPHVCFGLYFTDASRTSTCFEPFDSTCPSAFPVGCQGVSNTGVPVTPATTEVTTTSEATTVASETEPVVAPTSLPAETEPVVAVETVAPTSPPAPIQPSGAYRGSAMSGLLIMTATFSSSAVDIVFTFSGTDVSGAGIPYVMNGLNVELVEGPVLRGLLDQVNPNLNSNAITIRYNPDSDEVSGSFMRMNITGTRI